MNDQNRLPLLVVIAMISTLSFKTARPRTNPSGANQVTVQAKLVLSEVPRFREAPDLSAVTLQDRTLP